MNMEDGLQESHQMILEDDKKENQKMMFKDLPEDLIGKSKDDEKPIIWYGPYISSEKNSLIEYFENLDLALEFTQKLSTGFILIDATNHNEQDLLQNFKGHTQISGAPVSNSEKEWLFKKHFENMLNKNIQPYKAYSFCTQEEFINEASDNESDDEVVVMKGIDKMKNEFREKVFIWYDSNFIHVNKKEFANSFEIDEENVLIYDFDALEKKLRDSPDSPYHLILTREDEANKIVQKLGGFKGLLWIYVDFNDSQRLGPLNNKVIKIEGGFQEFIPKIKEKIDNMLRLDLPAYMTTSDACDKQRIYDFHLFLKKLKYKNRKQAKKDFLNLAKQVYFRKKDIALILEFEKDYTKYDRIKILYWYTRSSPINKLLNNCLRIATPDSIMYARFVLRDLERAIRDHYKESEKFSGVLYRSAYLSQEEWENLERNQGQEIEMLGFLSTSKKISVVEKWIDVNSQNKVLMKIVVPYQLDPPKFADIAKVSYYMREEEVLFNVRSRFQIMKTEVRDGVRCVVLLYDPSLSSYLMSRIKIKYPSDLEQKCQGCPSQDNLFFEYQAKRIDCNDCRMKAVTSRYIPLEKILQFENPNILSSQGWMCHDCEEVALKIYYKEHNIERGKASHKRCLECFQTNKERKLDLSLLAVENPKILDEDCGIYEMTTHDFQSCFSIDCQGDLFLKVKKYVECREYCQKRLEKIFSKRFREQERLGLYDLLGKSSKYLSFGQEAKEYLSNNLKMTQSIFGKGHPKTAIASHNLAVVQMSLQENMEALQLFEASVEITKSFYQEESLKTVKALTTFAEMLTLSNRGEEAIIKLEEALGVTRKINGGMNLNTPKAYHNLSIAYQSLGNEKKANEAFQNALNTSISVLRKTAPSKAALYNLLASIFQSIAENESFGFDQKFKHLEETKLILMEKISQIECQTQNLKEICENLGEIQKGLEWFFETRDARAFTYAKENKITGTVDIALGNVYQTLAKDRVSNINKSINEEPNPNYLIIDKSQLSKHLEQYQKSSQSDMTTSDGSKFIESREEDAMEQEFSNYEESNEFNSLQNDHESLESKKLQEKLKMRHENYALLQKSLGKYLKAIQHLVGALRMIESNDGQNCRETASLHHRLALMHQSLQNYEEAEKHHKQALEITESALNKNPQDLLASYSDLALTYEHLGRNSEALIYQNKALKVLESTYPKNFPEIASYENHIAILNEKLENYKDAQEGYEKAGKTMSICGENHLDIATSYNNIASIKIILAQFEAAFHDFSKALEITRAIKGEKHPNIAASLVYRARVLRNQAKYKEELENCQKAFEILKSVYGEKHPRTVTALNGIAIAYKNLGEFKEAEKYQRKALKISNSIHGIKHSDTAGSYNNLANLYAKQKKMETAFIFSRRALKITKSIYGKKHLQTAFSFNNLASLYKDFDDHEKALTYYDKALKIFEIFSQGGYPHHPQIALSYHNKALIYEKQNRDQDALDYFEKAFKICVSNQECPPSYFETINRSFTLMHIKLGKNKKDDSFFSKALEIRDQCFRKYHGEKKDGFLDLAILHRALGNDEEAYENLVKFQQESTNKKSNQTQQSRWKHPK